jgi:uncharacterized protein YceK
MIARLLILMTLLLAGCSTISEHDRAELSLAPGQRVALASAAHSSSDWRKLRNEYISVFPACRVCGIVAKGNQVHHIKPRHTHPELFLDRSNLDTLCQRHHYWIGHGGKSWSGANTNYAESLKAFELAAETIRP